MSFGWYLARPRGSPIGPLRAEALARRIRGGSLSPAELVWKEGMTGWTKIAYVPDLMGDIVEEGAPDTPPETLREPSLRFPEDEAPETRRGAAPPAVLERARGPTKRTTKGFEGELAPLARAVTDLTETVPVSDVVGSEHVESIEAPPETRDFGSKGMVIATTALPGLGDTASRPVAAPKLGGPPPPDAVVTTKLSDPLPPHTVRLPSAPPRPPGLDGPQQGSIAVYEKAPYLQLMAEQEVAPPESAAPPPYPSDFPRAAEPPAPRQVTLAMPRPRAIDIVGPASGTAPPAGGAVPPGSGLGRWLLALVTLLALVAGFLAARYVVGRRKPVVHASVSTGQAP